MKTELKKYLIDFLESELEEFGLEFSILEDDVYWDDENIESYSVSIKDTSKDDNYNQKKFANLFFRLSQENKYKNGCKIEIELSEDNFNEISDFDWTVKYFWLVLLKL